MVSRQQLQSVGRNCPGYAPIEAMTNLEENEENVRCDTCIHWVNGRCDIDLFDEVLESLDQT
ncbi:hypothetical protein [Thermovenabulum sp.]|uniref:hypothetical protein n=1 Tax=Thermovenabulum sp. TaxID=3100335 RepID=UPI003C7E4C9D